VPYAAHTKLQLQAIKFRSRILGCPATLITLVALLPTGPFQNVLHAGHPTSLTIIVSRHCVCNGSAHPQGKGEKGGATNVRQ